jgi:SUN domain-containing protein 1/2
MSFTSTPLGQSRRVADHSTFLGKDKPRPASPQRPIPTSYSYGGPSTNAKSPPKLSSSGTNNHSDSALVRFARLKQAPHSTDSITSPHPEKWAVKDTSVQIAAAFQQAANQMNPTEQWAAGSRPKSHVPRSTSVEYNESQRSLQHRLAAPPSRGGSTRAVPRQARPTSNRQQGSDEEADQPSTSFQRGKSPFDTVVNAASRAAAYYLKPGANKSNSQHNGNHSYDYSAEEREVNANAPNSSMRRSANHKRGRISIDNKAYKPSKSDLEDSPSDSSDDGPKRRRRKKGGPSGGPLTNLPSVGYGAKPKKRSKKNKSNNNIDAEEDESESEPVDEASIDQEPPRRTSRQPSRESIPPEAQEPDYSIDAEQGLQVIPEEIEEPVAIQVKAQEATSKPLGVTRLRSPKTNKFKEGSIGAALGHTIFLFFSSVAFVFRWLGRMLGNGLRLLKKHPAVPLVILSLASLALWTLTSGIPLPSLPFTSRPTFVPSDRPVADLSEFSDRLLKIEKALANLSTQSERTATRQDNESKAQSDAASRLSALETRLMKELTRLSESDAQSRVSSSQTMQGLKHDLETLRGMLQQVQSESKATGESVNTIITHAPDEEAREKLRTLEERLGSVEGGVKEAIELSKNAVKTDSGSIWKNLVGTKNGIMIKSSDGQDVGALINHLVESAVSLHGKDGLARPDFAMYSSGAAVIPSLTSPVLELKPKGITDRVFGLIRGDGFAVGRPPIVALHHEIHNGHCWPFAGSEGQLGIKLSAPVVIDDVTIDHAARESVLHESDLRSAPRDLELWGLVEGKENLNKVREWRAERERRRLEAQENGEPISEDLLEPPYPISLPSSAPYIRIAKFAYDIHSPRNIQTFPVLQEIKDLGLDFGVVALRVLNNWGRSEFTCLYRVRVHGERLGASESPALPTYEDLATGGQS